MTNKKKLQSTVIRPKKVIISRKVDLDTCGAGFFLGITRRDDIEAVNAATPEQLTDPEIICIECGGSGRTAENNWDHHDPNGPKNSATWQVVEVINKKDTSKAPLRVSLQTDWERVRTVENRKVFAEYIDVLDTKGPRELRIISGKTPKVSLSDVFSGMLLLVRDSVEQFHQGVEILRTAWNLDAEEIPFGEMPIRKIRPWRHYIAAKEENSKQIAQAVKSVRWETASSGKKIGYLESEFIGTPGALYDAGAQIIVVLNPKFAQPPIRKFTIAGNGIRVDALLPKLNVLETGWGGPATGTIIGSPREGSNVKLEQVVQIVQETL